MMDLVDVILKRRSIRRYTGEKIPEEKLTRILQAGLLSPTSRNLKPWSFYVVKDPNYLQKLSKVKRSGGGLLAECSAAIAVFCDSERADAWLEDCSIALSYMMLMAEEQGIGNCWVQIHLRADAEDRSAEENVRELLEVPEKYRIAGILALGIPEEVVKPHTLEEADWDKVHFV